MIFSRFKWILEPADAAESIVSATTTDTTKLFLPFYAWHIFYLIKQIPYIETLFKTYVITFENVTKTTLKISPKLKE